MAINTKIQSSINQMINFEWNAFYAFLAVSAWFETTPYKGFSKLLLEKAEREQRHSLQFYNFLKQRIGVIDLGPVNDPRKEFDSPLEAFEYVLALKRAITKSEHNLLEIASEEGDYQTVEFLLKILQESILEERNMQDVVDKVGFAEGSPDAMLHLDFKEEKAYAASKH